MGSFLKVCRSFAASKLCVLLLPAFLGLAQQRCYSPTSVLHPYQSVILRKEISGVSQRFPFRVFIYLVPGQYVLLSPRRPVLLQEALVKIISCV